MSLPATGISLQRNAFPPLTTLWPLGHSLLPVEVINPEMMEIVIVLRVLLSSRAIAAYGTCHRFRQRHL